MTEIIGLILAAGASSRMGFPKALIKYGESSLMSLHIDTLLTCCQFVRVVTGAHAEQLREYIGKAEEYHNVNWASTEMRHSILIGLDGLDAATLVVLTPIDTLPLRPEILKKLITKTPPAVVAHQGKRGHPVLATAGWLRMALQKAPLNQMLNHAELVEADQDILLNFNYAEDWKLWAKDFPRSIGHVDHSK